MREIDISYHIGTRTRRLAEKRAEVKRLKKMGENVKELEEELNKTKQAIVKRYSLAALEYEAASAYLYNTYSRKDRYKKV